MPKVGGPGKQKKHAYYILNVSTEVKSTSKGQKCKYCNEIFSSIKKLKRHKKEAHKDIKVFPCGNCDEAFTKNSKLKKHIQIILEGVCKCSLCGKEMSSKSVLKMHFKYLHERIKDEKCEICNKWFAG